MSQVSTAGQQVNAAEVARWFQEAARSRLAEVPDERSPHIAIIVDRLREFHLQINRTYPAAEQARLIAMTSKYQDIGKRLLKIHAELIPFRERAVEDLSEDDPFIETVDRTISLIKAEWIEPGHASNGREPPLWHQWAVDLHAQIVAAWKSVGMNRSSINANNPSMRVLKRALTSIDGNDRDEKTIEKALRDRLSPRKSRKQSTTDPGRVS